jgi:signal transduction histidine kinase
LIKLSYILSLFFLIIVLTPTIFCKDGNGYSSSQSLINLDGDWLYKIGNSPVDKNGNPVLLCEPDDTSWEKTNSPVEIKRLAETKDIWLKKKLPEIKINGQSLFLSYVINIMEVYLGDRLIYHSGDFKTKNNELPQGWTWYIIELPDDYAGKILTLHIRSSAGYAGIKGVIQIGSGKDFIYSIIDQNLIKSILGFIFLIAGFICLLLFLSLKELRNNIGFVIAQISMGIWTLTESSLTQLVIYAPTVLYYAYHISLYSGVIGFTLFVETLVAEMYKSIMKKLWQLQLIYAISFSVYDIFIMPEHQMLMTPFFIFICISILFFFRAGYKSMKIINPDKRMLLIAMAIYASFGLIEVLWYFHNILYNSWASIDTHLIHYGGFFFFGFLTWNIISHYVKVNRQLIASQNEAIKNQQIAHQAIKNEKEVKEKFTRNLLTSQEDERKRIAGELHDSLGQELLIIKNRALLGVNENCDEQGMKNHLNEISTLSAQAINEVRQITYNLRPFQLDRLGLTKALQSLVTRAESSSEIKFKMFMDNIDNLFPKDLEINIYRIIQEGINNVIKHSCAASVVIMVSKDDNEVCISVEDNGKGFDVDENNRNEKSGFGLSGINERASILGGKITIVTSPGKGTVLRIIIPITKTEQ